MFGNYGTKYNLWIGYMIDYAPMATISGQNPAWILPGKFNYPFELFTKTYGRIKGLFNMKVTLNKSDKQYFNTTVKIPGVVPYCDIGQDDGLFYVDVTNETDVTTLTGRCQNIAFVDSPSYDGGKQAWYHIYTRQRD
jgi:hypothetical protein